MAKSAGCFSIVTNHKGEILLAKRKDYPLWDLPGGKLEQGEMLVDCAIRETKEETGYIISIKRKIGEYYQPQYDDTQHLFLAELEGGLPIQDGPETEKVEWFLPNNLPLWMIPNRKKQIKNYLLNEDIFTKASITVSRFKIYFLKSFLKAFGRWV
ncbi:NUDIX hydrolase [Aquibacillus kalidii]|uniref:NUDIX hydrolase n=1 Tax=Aquibacillus kalidii TaxID=2762597 RepID=UPI001646DE2F|nr:NUDIX hydrolase [Aquibacillus kalidii]